MNYKVLLIGLLGLTNVSFAEICGFDDDRIASNDSRVGRLSIMGQDGKDSRSRCTVALISKSCIVTSQTCTKLDRAEFEVPSSIMSVPQSADERDVFMVNSESWQISKTNKKTKAWAVAKLKRNSVSGEYPGERYGYFSLQMDQLENDTPIQIIQYAKTDPTRFHVIAEYVGENPNGHQLNYSQSLDEGLVTRRGFFYRGFFEHNVDTNHGGAGAPVVNKENGMLIGVNTHAGCRPTGQRKSHRRVKDTDGKWKNGGNSFFGDREFKKAIQSCLNSEQ